MSAHAVGQSGVRCVDTAHSYHNYAAVTPSADPDDATASSTAGRRTIDHGRALTPHGQPAVLDTLPAAVGAPPEAGAH